MILQLLDGLDSKYVEAGLKWIEANYSHDLESPPRFAHYAWYYQAQAMYNGDKAAFRKWDKTCSVTLVNSQEEDGHWEPLTDNALCNDVYSTTLCTLTLEVYYRLLETSWAKGMKKPEDSVFQFADDDDLGDIILIR